MCITFLYLNPGNSEVKYKLILINNRDEFYGRSTLDATLKIDEEKQKYQIFGTDMAAKFHGTWLGLSATAGKIKIGNLLNITDKDIRGKKGRGSIVTEFIDSEVFMDDYHEKLFGDGEIYNSFNYVSISITPEGIDAEYSCNSPKIIQKLPLGVLGFGNSPYSIPFKKVERGKEKFKDILDKSQDKTDNELVTEFMELLKCTEKFLPDDELTARRGDAAEIFSSIHVEIPDEGYGTRTRTIILIDHYNNIDYIEETMSTEDPNGKWRTAKLNIPSSVFN